MTEEVEKARSDALVAAEQKAEKVFEVIEQEIYALPLRDFGVEKHWHKRIVRAGSNTLTTAGGGVIAVHIVSEFPYSYILGDKELGRISPRNTKRMRDPVELGRVRHWILEIHLVDRARTFGGFYERLL